MRHLREAIGRSVVVGLGLLATCGAPAACGDDDGSPLDAGLRDVATDALERPDGAASEAAWAATLAHARDWLAEREVAGMTLAVVVDGEVRFADGLGVRSWGSTEPVTADTRFHWLSVTKMHTAAAAVRLVEMGALDLDAPVVELVPELMLADDGDVRAITTRHLLTHTSGLPTTMPFYEGICDRSLAEVWAEWAPAPWAPAGALFVYNNFAAFSLAGLVVERAAGMPFDQAVEALVFQPTGMSTATFDPQEVFDAEHAEGATRDAEGEVTVHRLEDGTRLCPVELGTGGMAATASDVAKTIAMHLAGGAPLMTAASEAAMRDQVDTLATPDGESRYGLGLYRRLHRGTVVLDAWAWGGGFRGQVVMAPELGWGIAVASNCEWANPGEVAWAALDRFFPELPDDAPDFTTEPTTWTRYEGEYPSPAVFGYVTVELRAERLHLLPAFPSVDWPLDQVSGDLFEGTAPNGGQFYVQFVVPPGCETAEWLAIFGGGESAVWPDVRLGVAHRAPTGCH